MKGEKSIKIFPSHVRLAEGFAEDLKEMVDKYQALERSFTIALSGGNTPKFLYPIISARLKNRISWEKVHIFWVDERCVPSQDNDSNYGMTKRFLLDTIDIPPVNVHRIIGEALPSEEAIRYAAEIVDFTVSDGKLPVFDLVVLGLGDDGHTASIFPGNSNSFISGKVSETAIHPVSHQKRITITGSVINNAANVFFIVIGASKAKIVSEIIKGETTTDLPASKVSPRNGVLRWYLDREAAGLIDQNEIFNNN